MEACENIREPYASFATGDVATLMHVLFDLSLLVTAYLRASKRPSSSPFWTHCQDKGDVVVYDVPLMFSGADIDGCDTNRPICATGMLRNRHGRLG